MLSRWRFWRRRGGEHSARDISTPPPHHVASTHIEQVRTGLMTEHEAGLSPYRNVITRGVGVEERVDAGEIARVALGPGDVVLVCSDGLYGMISEAEIERVIGGGQSLETAAHELVRLANEAGGADNISLALYQRPARAENGD